MKRIIIAASIAVMSAGANAELPTFNFVKAGYSVLELDLVEGDFVGYEAEGSLELEDNFYMVGKYVATDDKDLELDQVRATLGFGYIQELTEDSALYIQVEYAAVRFDRLSSGRFEERGAQYGVGYRGRLFNSFEYDVSVKKMNIGEVDPTFGDFNQTFVSLGANYSIFDSFAVYADFELESDSNRYAAGLKYAF